MLGKGLKDWIDNQLAATVGPCRRVERAIQPKQKEGQGCVVGIGGALYEMAEIFKIMRKNYGHFFSILQRLLNTKQKSNVFTISQ